MRELRSTGNTDVALIVLRLWPSASHRASHDRGAIHPILIFRFQLWKVGHIGRVTLSLSDQVQHQRKKGGWERLR